MCYNNGLKGCWKKKRSPAETDCRSVGVYCVHLKKGLSSRSIGHKATWVDKMFVCECACVVVGAMIGQRENNWENKTYYHAGTLSENVWLWDGCVKRQRRRCFEHENCNINKSQSKRGFALIRPCSPILWYFYRQVKGGLTSPCWMHGHVLRGQGKGPLLSPELKAISW